jgi:3-hydroxy-9,10-secoandrosta-1,3,5(10)-triene-9,17-dione monooxygenase reductase component
LSATPAEFRALLSRWASGVSVVTSNDAGMLYGLTVSSFSSLSLDPPLILVCLANANRIVGMIEGSGGFAVSILSSEQKAASAYFAQAGRLPTPHFTEIEGEWTSSGQPVIAGSLAWATCQTHALIAEGDHTIVIGKVAETFVAEGKEPLLYWARGYRSIGPEI